MHNIINRIITIICCLWCLFSAGQAGAQHRFARWGLFAGLELPIQIEDAYGDLRCLRTSDFNFGIQMRFGNSLHLNTGIRYFADRQTFTRSDSSAGLKNAYLGIPVQLGLNLLDFGNCKLRLATGMEYRALVWISPNDLDIRIKGEEFNQNNLDWISSLGIDWNRLTLDFSYRRTLTSVLQHSKTNTNRVWISLGFLF